MFPSSDSSVNAGLGVSFVSILANKDELLSKRINSVMIDGIRINKRLSTIINNKVYKSLLFNFFYHYCLFLLERDFKY